DFVLGRRLPGGRRRNKANRSAATAYALGTDQRVELVVQRKSAGRQAPERGPQGGEARRIERLTPGIGPHPPASRQPTVSPARSGTTVVAPKGSSSGTVQASLHKLIELVLRGHP